MLFPSPAREYTEPGIDLNKELIQHPHATFFMQVETDAMIDAHMPPGSLLVIDRAIPAKNGDIIVAVLSGAFTVRRLVKNEHTCWLYPANRQYREQKITPEMNMTIWGVVIQIIVNPKAVINI
ncbi:MAG: translesion error-prone DNA polymerase V autoproteolytic subunit [Williamsia sp.]|nr:translesion error-prone DNA polymerase V autoproteolytic subunit [Williamsia sp.]